MVWRAIGRIGARGVSSAALGLGLLLIARTTSLTEFGHFMIAYSVGLVVGLVAGIGAPVRVLRIGADKKSDAGLLFVVHSVLVLGAFGAAFGFCVVTHSACAVYAGLILALGDTVQNFAIAQMTAQDRHVIANSLVLSQRLVPLVALLALQIEFDSIPFGMLAAAFGVPVLAGLLTPLASSSVRDTRRRWKSVFTNWFGYWAYSLSALLSQLQVPVLAWVATSEVVALYAMAARVVGPIAILTASLSAVAVPELTRRLSDRDRFDSLFRMILGLSTGYLVLVVALAWPIALVVSMLAGPQYSAAHAVIAAMVVGAGISGCSQAFNSKLIAIGAPQAATRAITAGGLTALVVLVILGLTHNTPLLWVVPLACEYVVVAIISYESSRATIPPTGRTR